MATYYPTSTNTKEVVPTLYSRDPSHVLYNEVTLPGNMMYMNYLSSGSYSDNLAPNSQPQQNTVELSVPNNLLLQGSSMGESDFIASRLGVQGYNNAWRDGRNELPFMQTLTESMDNTDGLARNSVSESPQMGRGMQMGVLNRQNLSLQQSNSSAVQGQGLSLSLGTQIPTSSLLYQPSIPNMSVMSSHQTTSGNIEPVGDDSSREKQVHAYPSPYGVSTLASTIPNSKYLKAAQQVLDEVVNVRKSLKGKLEKSQSMHNSAGNSGKENEEGSKSEGAAANNNESTANSTAELSPTERQDLQNKLTKLLAMLDEVDRRYKQYYRQMQIVVSSFDVIAGSGAAKPYTALALQTISRHFRCLRDAINGQIQAARKSLGEQDGSNKEGAISRLRYIDQHLRQQRAFQQFGMMQQHAWRPQRGLPENSVTILRAWLFEHFLHPYPKDSDKVMLARQTGLTRSQVSNWFINARVRLWKPMVEEMYKEEIGDAEMDSNSLSENPPKGLEENGQSEDKEDDQSMKSAAGKSQSSQFDDNPKSSLVPDMETINAPPSGFEGNNYMNLKTSGTSTNNVDDSHLLQDALAQHDGSGSFMSYPMVELSRYGATGVSLTLGLQHCEGGLPGPDGHNNFMAMRGDEFNPTPTLGDDTTEYNYINMASNRHRFGPSQLLHDFVA